MKGNKLESSESWSESKLKALFPHSADVQIHNFRLEDDGCSEVTLIYSEGLCDTTQIGRVVLPQLKNMYRQHGFTDLQGDNVYGTLPIHPVEAEATPVEIAELLFQGISCCCFLKPQLYLECVSVIVLSALLKNQVQRYRSRVPKMDS